MAEGYSKVQSKTLCRYFVHGACQKGDDCRFSHDRHNKMDNVCRYYLKGCCIFADRCRYDHVKPKGTNKSSAQTQTPPTHALPPLKTLTETPTSNMVSLKKALKGEETTLKTPKPPEEWVQACEFVPGQPYHSLSIPSSYAHAASNGTDTASLPVEMPADPTGLLCPFSVNKECPYGEDCEYIHGEICDLCGQAVLHPHDTDQNDMHRKACMEQHERDMELSFAVARSQDKQCGICMDTVLEKEPPKERRFGIMSDCTHCFCLACIRKWRASKQFDSKTIRSCPECRVQSDFVTPSQFWVDTKEEKIKLIQGYKRALSEKPCKYFDQGRGECPFNDRCFYQHVYPDGTRAIAQPRQPRSRHNADGDRSIPERLFLWDFLQERHDRVDSLLLLEVLEDDLTSLLFNINFSTDSSDDSDNELW